MTLRKIPKKLKLSYSFLEKKKKAFFIIFAVICFISSYFCYNEDDLRSLDVEWLNEPRIIGGISYNRINNPKICVFEENGKNASFYTFTINEIKPIKHGRYITHCEGIECEDLFPIECQSICFFVYPSDEQPRYLWIGTLTITEDEQNQVDVYRLIDDWKTNFPECISRNPSIFSNKDENVLNLGFSFKKQIYPETGKPEQLVAYYVLRKQSTTSMQYYAFDIDDPKKIRSPDSASWFSWNGIASDLVFFGVPSSSIEDTTEAFYRVYRMETTEEAAETTEEPRGLIIEWSKCPVFVNEVKTSNKIEKYGDFVKIPLSIESLSFSVFPISHRSYIALLSLERVHFAEEYNLLLYVIPRCDLLNDEGEDDIKEKIPICRQEKRNNEINILFKNTDANYHLKDYLITEDSTIDAIITQDGYIYFVMVVKNNDTGQNHLIIGSFSLAEDWSYVSVSIVFLFAGSFLFSAFTLSLLLSESEIFNTLNIMILALGILLIILYFFDCLRIVLPGFVDVWMPPLSLVLISLGLKSIYAGYQRKMQKGLSQL
ncbi:MAG: hypothetical protein HXS48_20005 [Theionarchaea archaeon]|nr:hypothetical protein [Theionarchaea archaeon]